MIILKRINYPLAIGIIIVIILIFIVIYGELIIRLDPYLYQTGAVQTESGEYIKHPLPPNKINIFGTDRLGRDIFSRTIWGARFTLRIGLLATLIRFLCAIPFAFIAGFGGKLASKVIDFCNMVSSAIPALIISILLLKIELFNESMTGFIIVLIFVGWGRVAYKLRENIKGILKEDFIEGEIAIGKNKFMIALQNVLPHLTASIFIDIFIEMGNSLLLIAGLGVFNVYVRLSEINPLEDLWQYQEMYIKPSYDPEWGSMLATARYSITARKPWIAIFPALAFFITIMGLNLLGEGIKMEINKRKSKFITWIKKIPLYVSPKSFVYEIKNYSKYKKRVWIKTIVLIVFLVLYMMPPSRSLYEINGDSIYVHGEELLKEKYGDRMLGTNGHEEAFKYITTQLEDCNVEPYFKGSMVEEFLLRSSPYVEIVESNLSVEDDNRNNLADFSYRKDYNIHSIQFGFYFTFEEFEKGISHVFRGNLKNYKEYTEKNGKIYGKNFILMDGNIDLENDNEIIEKVRTNKYVDGVIIKVKEEELLGKTNPIDIHAFVNINPKEKRGYVPRKMKNEINSSIILVNEQAYNILKEYVGNNLVINVKTKMIDMYGKNIGVMIKGNGKYPKDALIITTNYDFEPNPNKDKGLYYNGTSIGTMIEIIKILSNINKKPNRDIVFLFLDSSKVDSQGANRYACDEYMYTDKNVFYIQLNNLGAFSSDKLYLNTAFLSLRNHMAYRDARYIKKRASQLGIKLEEEKVRSTYEDISEFDGMPGSRISLRGVPDSYARENINDPIVSKENLRKQAQLILDAIVRIAYD
jgi:ABC-type dipeptide/oligopeptide/nickel transport system permease subunit